MSNQRFIVKESYGYGHHTSILINETTAPREVSQSRKNALIREYRQYDNDYGVSDVDSAGWRIITARHWINGFENIRVLHIRPSTTYARITLGME
jgi:hypothetical protein